MAKTTGKIQGNLKMLYMDDTLVGCSTANGFSLTNETIESTCKTGDVKPPRTYEEGLQEASITGTFVTKFDDANQYSALAAAAKNASTHTWKQATSNPDDPYWQFDGFISSFNEVANQGDMMTVDITISPQGEIYLFNT